MSSIPVHSWRTYIFGDPALDKGKQARRIANILAIQVQTLVLACKGDFFGIADSSLPNVRVNRYWLIRTLILVANDPCYEQVIGR